MAVEDLSHALGEADAAVGGGVAGEVAFVHAGGTGDAHEVGHSGRVKQGTRGTRIFAHINLALQDGAILADVVAEQGGGVIDVFLHDGETASPGGHAFTTRGNRRDAGKLAAFVKVDFLLAQTDQHARRARQGVAVPLAFIIPGGWRLCSLRYPGCAWGAGSLVHRDFFNPEGTRAGNRMADFDDI